MNHINNVGYQDGSRREGWGEVVQSIQNLSGLPGNWDGEGSEPPSPEILSRAIQITEELRKSKLPPPTTAVATRAGIVLFTWQDPSDYRELEVTESGIETMFIDENGVATHKNIKVPPQTIESVIRGSHWGEAG
jgi:hypothetical protein